MMEELLPGFRFHPTEEELLEFYLKQQVVHLQQHGNKKKKKKLDIVIPTVQLYRHEPWELPGMAPRIVSREREWYFFVPRDDRRKQQQRRPSRTTERGFWKATGSDRAVRCAGDPNKRLIGLKKTLVYYEGRAPRGTKTDWVMNEYRLPDSDTRTTTSSPPSTCMVVLCKIYRKAVSLKQLEQRVAMEEQQQLVLASANADATHSSTTAGSTSSSSSEPQQQQEEVEMKKEVVVEACVVARPATQRLPQLEIARPSSSSQPHRRLQEVESEWMMWMQEDPFLTQLRSPCMEGCWSSPPAYYTATTAPAAATAASVLNF